MKLYYDHDHIYKILILLIQNVSFLSLLSLSLSPSLALLSHPSVLFYILSSLLSPSLSLLLSLSRLSSPLLSFPLSLPLSIPLSLSLFFRQGYGAGVLPPTPHACASPTVAEDKKIHAGHGIRVPKKENTINKKREKQ